MRDEGFRLVLNQNRVTAKSNYRCFFEAPWHGWSRPSKWAERCCTAAWERWSPAMRPRPSRLFVKLWFVILFGKWWKTLNKTKLFIHCTAKAFYIYCPWTKSQVAIQIALAVCQQCEPRPRHLFFLSGGLGESHESGEPREGLHWQAALPSSVAGCLWGSWFRCPRCPAAVDLIGTSSGCLRQPGAAQERALFAGDAPGGMMFFPVCHGKNLGGNMRKLFVWLVETGFLQVFTFRFGMINWMLWNHLLGFPDNGLRWICWSPGWTSFWPMELGMNIMIV